MTERPIRELLRVRDLCVDYRGGRRALDGLNLSVMPRQTVGLIGSSGSGKTTAARAILNLLPPGAKVAGSVELDGQSVRGLPERAMRHLRWERLALVPQAAMNALDPVIPVDRQIAEVVRAHRSVDRRTALELAHDSLGRVGIHPDRASSYPHQFSGGMRQRVSIAMATVLEPDVLIADEPTTGLDVVVQDRILELLLQERRRSDLALVVVTHDLGVANELCDDMVVLERGRTVASGPSDVVLSTRIARDRTNARHSHQDHSSPALEARELTVSYQTGRGLAALQRSNELTALDRVSLTVGRGEIVGLAGESGCGKSSLVSALIGLQPIDSGSIRIGRTEVADPRTASWDSLRQHIQMIFQDPYDSLNPRLTVRETVQEPLSAQRLASGSAAEARVRSALENAGLTPVEDYWDRLPHQLSGGERQRVAIARALVVEPQVILADEPVSMLDEETAQGVVGVLLDLAHRMGVAILLVSHDVGLLRRVCDRVAVMYLGRLVEVGDTRKVLDTPRHPYTEALVRAVPSRRPGVRRKRVLLRGEAPSLHNRPTGCAFHPRCPLATGLCSAEEPSLLPDPTSPAPGDESTQAHHESACWHSPTAPVELEKGHAPA